ncbi:ATP-binding protein [Catelliglobosispora koreensis]|uniref:ATP-binding protein n=1 Tax=Catelliglobosispora koreensis TaxID=129052 RepID=UPI0003AAF5D6|nr:ATP-binding protein [Catelliglobosispora koreensis]
MNGLEKHALSSLRFDVAPIPDDVWRPSPFHVESLHAEVLETIMDGLGNTRLGADGNPNGVVVQGIAGSGKTHLLGWVREKAQGAGSYFFLVSLLDGSMFWKSTVLAVIDGLQQPHSGLNTQLGVLLRRLCSELGVRTELARTICDGKLENREQLDEFIGALHKRAGRVALASQHTARALVLLASERMSLQDIAYSYLQSIGEMEAGERAAWGIHPETKIPQQVVRELFQLMALTGSSLIAVDQIDTLIAQAATSTDGLGEESKEQVALVNQVADGLVSLRELATRTLTVIASLPSTWTILTSQAAKPFEDRFHRPTTLKPIANASVAKQILEKRFARRFEQVGFKPPYATWPIRPEALEGVHELTPRRLISRVNDHIMACLRDDTVMELQSWDARPVPTEGPPDPRPPASPTLSARFDELRKGSRIEAALSPDTEDLEMSSLLNAGLAAWIQEQGAAKHTFKLDARQGGKHPLHARLRQVLHDERDDEQHWSFRGISHTHGVSILSRILAARTAAGLSKGISKRKLVFLRNIEWNKGPKNKEAIQDFTDAGGVTLGVSEEDLKTFAALKQMLSERDPSLEDWLRANRPASKTTLLRTVLSEVAASLEADEAEQQPEPESLFEPPKTKLNGRAVVPLGNGVDEPGGLHVDLESLRKHTAIFAGSGSGKTVLIRRLIEECALQGVSTIVLDPNNDLARLGDGWPATPSGWASGDSSKAQEYLANTDVVVWTPRREAGRPLSFQPLPDFRSILKDPDELGIAIDATVASLAPRAKVDGESAKALRGRAVLKEALDYFAKTGTGGIKPFIGVLNSLPEGISQLDDAEKIAFEMSQNLMAAVVTDPLFGGAGAAVDPGLLLTPPEGKRARISVISFIGLPSEEQRQSFVNQLQMALFAWIKQNPAGNRPLGGLLVMDEAQTLAPSSPMTACTMSTLALASQARKYGLGLVFATQAPKGLHNRISGNAATQFFGLLNAPVQIEAAREMARAKGGDVPDISRLKTGQFYASGEGFTLRKVQTPLCLSYHPSSPLTTEEVVERAKAQ